MYKMKTCMKELRGWLKVLRLKVSQLMELGIVKWCDIFNTCNVFQENYLFLPVYGTLT